jgi:FkbH-like protein
VASVAAAVGTSNWFSAAQWNMGKLPFADSFVPLYADHVARLIGALRGKARRCLVLDLDDTVWGGIIGDDGVEGIRIAQGDSVGEAFLAIQRMALSLRERGIALAVSSKNEDATARIPFRKHPEMLLREEHIAVFQANWKDKASNITAIAETLNLGLESLVFLDDNPVERELVRRTLPEVGVPELPEDPALYPFALIAGGYFEATSLSEEDKKRAAFYEGNARRVQLKAEVADVDAYLASLNMEITFEPFDELGRARIAQLISKSNQFNLTTRRYSEADVAQIAAEPDAFTLQVRLTDSIGDNGMISVIVCRKTAVDTWTIDTWLMSCRVLGRRVEEMVLREIGRNAALAGVGRLIGEYLPTERNMMVKDHYRKLGFALISEAADGTTRWELALPVTLKPAPMAVTRRGFATEAALAADRT